MGLPSSLLPPSSMIPVFGAHSKMLILYPSTLFSISLLSLLIHEFTHKDRQNTTPTNPMGFSSLKLTSLLHQDGEREDNQPERVMSRSFSKKVLFHHQLFQHSLPTHRS